MDQSLSLPASRTTPYGSVMAQVVQCDDKPPESADVVIVGGGVIGVMTAWWLAREGKSVVLCEKAEIGCEASSRAYGWVMESMMAAINVPLSRLSKDLWAKVQGEVGEIGYRQHGLLNLAESQFEMDLYSGWLKGVEGIASPDTRMVTANEVAAMLPGAKKSFLGGLYAQSDGRIEPIIATSRVAAHARAKGAKLVQYCAVRGIDKAAGKVAGVWTERGYIRTSRVVVAAGSWSRLLLGNQGINVPQLHVFMSTGATGITPGGPADSGGTNAWSWSRRIDGSYGVGGFPGSTKAPISRDLLTQFKQFKPSFAAFDGGKGIADFGKDSWNDWLVPRSWNPRKTSPFERKGLRIRNGTPQPCVEGPLVTVKSVFDGMAHAAIVDNWSGPVTITPDNKGFIGPVEQMPGLYLCSGFPLGLTWGAALGKLTCEAILGQPTSMDIHPFRWSRFSDGSPLEIAM